jgi:pilus assembly protein CpaB
MPVRTILTLSVAVLLGLVAVFFARGYLFTVRKADAQAAAAAGTTQVVVAAQPVARGMTLQPQLLKLVRYPSEAVPAGAYTSVAQATNGGPIVLRDIAANEPVLAGRVAQPGAKLNLSTTLAQGMRAVTVRSNDVAGVAGFVLPGDRVDVMATRSVGNDARSTTLTQILAQNVKVLGVDQIANENADKPVVAKAITVEVTPDQAQTITLAQSVGSISLALRQIADAAPLARQVTTVADLGYARAPAAAAAPARPRASRPAARPQPQGAQVRVTRGVTTSSYEVRL